MAYNTAQLLAFRVLAPRSVAAPECCCIRMVSDSDRGADRANSQPDFANVDPNGGVRTQKRWFVRGVVVS